VVLGAVGILIGIISFVHAYRSSGSWAAGVGGVLSLLFGVLLLVYPLAEGIMLASVYGWLSLAGGAFVVTLALRMRAGRMTATQMPG
jgi:uncharacterized membrane protein HdeD (DUF308 family)